MNKVAIIIGSLLVACSTTAYSQAISDPVKEAQRLTRVAQVAQQQGRYDDAIKAYETIGVIAKGSPKIAAAALVNAYRATGDDFYREFLTQWVLPFYCKMLNHSDTLFSAKRNDARPGVKFPGFLIKLKKQSCVTSSAISTEPNKR